jgi:hypothetical protein
MAVTNNDTPTHATIGMQRIADFPNAHALLARRIKIPWLKKCGIRSIQSGNNYAGQFRLLKRSMGKFESKSVTR